MAEILYNIIIFPLVQIMEFIFVFIYKIFHNNLVFSVFGVGAAVSFLSLPLYIIAERWQRIERDAVKKMKPHVEKIKAVFQGDEQFMILSAFYRQNRYHPVYALRSTLGVAVQVPFFIAAYSYLSSLNILSDTRFLFIQNLTLPDSLFRFNSISINILPILMTVINCIGGAIYTKGFPLRDKIQLYGMALVFLVLLYNSPSALVLYWTVNNVFSLVKNIFYRIKNPLRVLYIMISLILAVFIFYLLFVMDGTRAFIRRLYVVSAVSLFFFLPLFLKAADALYKRILSGIRQDRITAIMLLSCSALALLCGLYIPSSIIASSPEEFSFIDNHNSPFLFLSHSASVFFGLAFLWPVCVYFLFGKRIRAYLAFMMLVITLLSSMYTVVFSGNYGVINNLFNFNTTAVLNARAAAAAASAAVLPAMFLCAIFFMKRLKRIEKKGNGRTVSNYPGIVLGILITVFSGVTAYNVLVIHKSYAAFRSRQNAGDMSAATLEPVFSLSKNDRNVVVIMEDGLINGFMPLAFSDNPSFNEQFDGFVYYPNTVSFAANTITGVPPVWGGYEYSPLEMNRRDEIPLREKHNEALLTLPVLLTQAGFDVTVCDPSWANYTWIPDTSIYDGYEKITAFNTISRYTALWYKLNEKDGSGQTLDAVKRNIIWFSLLKISLPPLRPIVYDNGWYWGTGNMGTSIVNFINSYAVLDFLPELTAFRQDAPSALLITNETTHNAVFLKENKPSAEPSRIGNTPYAESGSYQSNYSVYLKLGAWFDYLRENGVYDNTRIIITADHGGYAGGLLSDRRLPIPGESRERYNPMLMVKDFNSHGAPAANTDFMTNADVPLLALEDLIDNPKNPFTGNPLAGNQKAGGVFITSCHTPMANAHGKYRFNIKKNQWIHVRDSIIETENWKQAEITE